MNKKKKLFLSFTAIAGILVFALVLKYVLDNPFRKQLPEYPDFQNITESLQQQISAAGRKAALNPTADNLGELGMVYYSCVYNEKAGKCFQLAVKRNSNKWIWSYYLGYLNLEMGESNAAIVNFKNVVRKDPGNYLALFYSAEASQNLGSNSDAEKIFKRIAALDVVKKDTIKENDFPLQTYARFQLARIYINSNRPDSAEIILKEIIESQVTFGPAYRLLGNIYNKEGDTTLGNKYIIRANDFVEYTPPADMLIDRIALMSRSDTYLLKQIDDALHSLNFKWELKLFDHSLKYVPDSKFLLSKALFGYLFLNKGDLALPYLEKHYNLYRDDFNELMLFAILLYDKGYQSQGQIYFNQARKVKPGSSQLAIWLAERGRTDEAISLLDEQIKMDPENVSILTDAVRLYSSVNDDKKVSACLARIRQILPLSPEVKRLTGEVEEHRGNLKEAISLYEDAIKADPRNSFVIRHLANLYTKFNMWDKLLSHFRSSLDDNPNDPFVLEGLGRILISCKDTELRNIEESMEYSRRAFYNFKSTPMIKISAGKNLATAYAVSGDKKKAAVYIFLTSDLAMKFNAPQDYIEYFNNLRKQYNIPE